MDAHASGSGGEGPPRKRLRKGTRSCVECRRRKARCVYASEASTTCELCLARSLSCTSQEHEDESFDNRKNLRERVSYLEAIVQDVLQKLDSQTGPTDDREQQAVHALESLSTDTLTPGSLTADSPSKYPTAFENGPLQSLFDNAVITRETHKPTTDSEIGGKQPPELERKREKLLGLVPSKESIVAIFEASPAWWEAWKSFFPDIVSQYGDISMKDYGFQLLRDGSIYSISKLLLCLGISVQNLPPDFDLTRLRLARDPARLFETCVNAVEDLVSKDYQLGSTVEGIEIMILQANFSLNYGQPRNTWLTLRRAITYASLSGFHYVNSNAGPVASRDRVQSLLNSRKRNIMRLLYWTERHVSFVLGLPYSMMDQHSGIDFEQTSGPIVEQYLLRVSRIAGSVVDRNQEHQHGRTANYTSTLRLDEDLEALANTVPSSWWDSITSDTPATNINPMEVLAQFWHFHIRLLNHLPFMLLSATHKQYEYSLITCMQAAREMLQRYRIMRFHSGQEHCSCKVIDFQAFTAAVLMLVDLLGHRHSTHDVAQEERDWQLIDQTIDNLRRASMEFGGIIASQSLSALETLRKTKEGSQHKHGRLVIPFFGIIHISTQSATQRKHNYAQAQDAQPTPKYSDTSSREGNRENSPKPEAQFTFMPTPEDDPSVSFTSLFAADAEDQLFQGLSDIYQHSDLDQEWTWQLDNSADPLPS